LSYTPTIVENMQLKIMQWLYTRLAFYLCF